MLTVDNFDNWAISSVADAAIANTAIDVVPGAESLTFRLNQDAGADFLQSRFNLTVSGPATFGATLSMIGSTAGGNAAVSSTVDICEDFPGNEPVNCLTDHIILSVVHNALGPDPPVTEPLAFLSFFDVFVELSIDGGGTGPAALNGDVTLQLQAVPEPATLVLVASGLAACAAHRRRQRTSSSTRPLQRDGR
jgi:hypothetical protein